MLEGSTPILVGAGQSVEREVDPHQAQPPMGLAAQAAAAALADTGLGDSLARHIDTIYAIRSFSDSSNRPRLQLPFGRAQNPPRAIARRLGADPVQAIYGNVGGNTPQKYIDEAAERIAQGDADVVLLAGAEAIKTAQEALRRDLALNWQEDDEGSLDDRGLGETLMSAHEFAHGIGIPIQTYPLFENALRARLGNSQAQHDALLGRLCAEFSAVAANNPFAFYGTARSAEELTTVSAENRYICYPYPKLMNARDAVNQGAAVVMTSVAKAQELGIDPARWVYLHGCAESNEKLLVSERVDYHSSPAIRVAARHALDMAGIDLDQIDYFDLYSCFPSAVEICCEALGLDSFDPRGLTLTGGLPFFGGPGNNYSMHAIASLLPKLRAKPDSYGLITANGGYLSKHALGIYSCRPYRGKWCREDPAAYQVAIDRTPGPVFSERPAGAARIETYTLCFDRSGPQRGIVIGRLLDSDARFLANTPADPVLLQSMLAAEQVGRTGTVAAQGELNVFHPH